MSHPYHDLAEDPGRQPSSVYPSLPHQQYSDAFEDSPTPESPAPLDLPPVPAVFHQPASPVDDGPPVPTAPHRPPSPADDLPNALFEFMADANIRRQSQLPQRMMPTTPEAFAGALLPPRPLSVLDLIPLLANQPHLRGHHMRLALNMLTLSAGVARLTPNSADGRFHARLALAVLSSSQFASETMVVPSDSQVFLLLYLGANSQLLMPRMQTIELYRKNAKKSSDPAVIFQFAQYMLQTALMVDADGSSATGSVTSVGLPLARVAVLESEKQSNAKIRRDLLRESVLYLRKLSDKGYSEAQYLLADAYSLGALGKVEAREAFVLFQHAAKHGHAELAYRTAYCYEMGVGTGRDARKAIEYLKTAALRNHPAAMYKLGVYMFYLRSGIPNTINAKKAGIQWLTRAVGRATELTAAAPYELAKIHFAGFHDVVIPDRQYACELYAQAAALGHVPLAALLGKFYEMGEVVVQDPGLLVHYYTQAALGGDTELMLAMCAWYLVGAEPYLEKDEHEAFEWARRAADGGLPKAMMAVAHFYERGMGCTPNQKMADEWYRQAAVLGDGHAQKRIASGATGGAAAAPADPKAKNPKNGKDCVIM